MPGLLKKTRATKRAYSRANLERNHTDAVSATTYQSRSANVSRKASAQRMVVQEREKIKKTTQAVKATPHLN